MAAKAFIWHLVASGATDALLNRFSGFFY